MLRYINNWGGLMERLLLFNAKAYFTSRGIESIDKGKNVTKGWVNTRCIFCDDQSFHLGISKDLYYNCWRCKAKGSVAYLIQTIDHVEENQALDIIRQFSIFNPGVDTEPVSKPVASMEFPIGTTNLILPHRSYLESRNFNSFELERDYGLKSSGPIGKYKYRILIPVIEQETMVTFTSRDASGVMEARWLSHPAEESLKSIKHCLYNVDTVTDTAIIVEGPVDVWRMGSGCIGLFGLAWTSEQIVAIRNLNLKKVSILFDGESLAIQKAHELSYILSMFIPKVNVLELENGDPGELSLEDVFHIRELVFG